MALTGNRKEKLDKALVALVLTDFDKFCQIAGVDRTQAYVCLELERGKSTTQIAMGLGISRQAVWQRCRKCEIDSVPASAEEATAGESEERPVKVG